MLCSKQIGRPTTLPASITKRKGVQQPKSSGHVAFQSIFMWAPVQQAHSKKATCVGTLAMDVASWTFEGAKPYVVRIEKDNFVAKQPVWCYLLGGTCVVCKGLVVGRNIDGPQGSARQLRVARLPENLRPRRPLCFAALAHETMDDGGRTTTAGTLVTLVVSPDGDIVKVGGRSAEMAIDLSAVRFCKDSGISLLDEVSMHTVDVAGSRLVTLQGYLSEKTWSRGGHRKALAMLPESCQPKKDFHFIVPGLAQEGFHLILVTSGTKGNVGVGGELHWCDSIWNRDRINLTGVMYETSARAVDTSLKSKTDEEKLVAREALMKDFHRRLHRMCGSIQMGLTKVYGIRDEEEITFQEFMAGCKTLGYHGQMTKLWAILDEDMSGKVSYEELLGEDDVHNQLCDTDLPLTEADINQLSPNSLPAIAGSPPNSSRRPLGHPR